jgi:hypothetical protein
MQDFEGRLLQLVGDVLTALGKGELSADAPVVRAAGAALAELRRTPSAAPAPVPASVSGHGVATAVEQRGGTRAPRVATPVEQVLGVARRMVRERLTFAAACSAVAEELGTSAQAVRNAATRWLGASAAEWQPLVIEGAQAGVVALARRVAAKSPWLVDRVCVEFGLPPDALAAVAATAGAGAGAGVR